MRFRKSIKICKGVKLNLSKSGISTTFGVKGLSVTAGPKGTYLNTGIPGTGIYDRQKFSSGSSSAKKRTSEVAHQSSYLSSVYTRGINSSSSTFKRPVFSPPTYRAVSVPTVSSIQQALASLSPRTYSVAAFKEAAPQEEVIRQQLEAEASSTVSTLRFWSVKKRRQQYIDDRIADRVSLANSNWRSRKTAFEEEESKKKAEIDKKYFDEYSQQKCALENTLSTDPAVVNKLIADCFQSLSLPEATNATWILGDEASAIAVNIDLPSIESISQEDYTYTSKGFPKRVKRTQSAIRADYAQMIFSFAIFLSSNIFQASCAIHRIILSGRIQKRDKVGDLVTSYIYSIIFTRERFEDQPLEPADPIDFCMTFENRCKMSVTHVFKEIKPFILDVGNATMYNYSAPAAASPVAPQAVKEGYVVCPKCGTMQRAGRQACFNCSTRFE